MPQSAQAYFPQTNREINRFSLIVWAVIVALAFVWLGLIISAPILQANGLAQAAELIYTPFSYLCHQLEPRGFHLDGAPLAVCARCFGVYCGLAGGILIYPLMRSLNDLEPLPRLWLLLAPIPTTIDFLLGYSGIWANTHLSRFLTANILGVGIAFFLIPGIIEISRYTIYHLSFNIYRKSVK